MSGSYKFGGGEAVQQLRRSLPDQQVIREAVGQASGRIFNVSARCAAVEKLRESLREQETLRDQVEQASVRLFEQRQQVVAEVIEPVEEYVNGLANAPKEFDKSVRAFRIEIKRQLPSIWSATPHSDSKPASRLPKPAACPRSAFSAQPVMLTRS